MTKSNYTPSINIIRDAERDMEYIVTKNAEKAAIKIIDDFYIGYHCFNIIGSYGTGKSSFLWAFTQTILKKKEFFNLSHSKQLNTFEVINIVGNYSSLIDAFNETFFISDDFTSNQRLFDEIFQKYAKLGENGFLVIAIDEFGKFLEYAASNNPEREMYFIQQLAEFVNDPTRNILFLTTLHQGVDTYAIKLSDTQKNEWRKVKGRFQEITFNEPVDQLLSLASRHFIELLGQQKESKFSLSLVDLQKKNLIFGLNNEYLSVLKNSLYPLDVFSAYTLTLALQRYGQNERSLFSFLNSSDSLGLHDASRKNNHFSIASVYDYLLSNYYQLLSSKSNPDFSNWNSIKTALQRIEAYDLEIEVAEDIIKTIGLLQIFGSKASKINDNFIKIYLSEKYKGRDIDRTIGALTKVQIIRYSKFDFSYKLFEGTDLDIEDALIKVENQISAIDDLVAKLGTYFDFPVVTAKANSYITGTPRLFEYVLSEKPVNLIPEGEIDGFINLIFNSNLSVDEIKEETKNHKNAIIYAYFKNTDVISSALFDIEKTKQVLRNIEADGDLVAIKELLYILKNNRVLLNHFIIDSLFNSKVVEWIYNGEIITIQNKKALNKTLSAICKVVYHDTPIIRNELFNKHKVSGAIASARKNYFRALVNDFNKKDLGFDKEKFPPEKTIYHTLLVKNGMHVSTESGFTLTMPQEDSDLYGIWKICNEFMSSAKNERKSISELINTLTSAPYKLKQGIIDFWVPTFLFIRKGDYALYSDGNFKPYINEQELYLVTRVPENYAVKSFELNDLKLSFFNRYRDWLRQEESQNVTINTFIESIRPILLKYKELTDYAKKTTRLSAEALKLREAIEFAQDPEKVFFDEFPKALGFNAPDLLKSEENFDDYIYKFQETLEEIQNSYLNLLSRIEDFICEEIIGKKCEFLVYKKALSNRFSTLKEHQLLPKQKTFLLRINSALNDRDSWLASIGQLLAGKPLTGIDDRDENVLKDNLSHIVKELDNISVIEKLNYDQDKEEVFKLDFTTKKNGLIPHLVRIPKGKFDKVQNNIAVIQNELGEDKQMRIAILAKLLKGELEND